RSTWCGSFRMVSVVVVTTIAPLTHRVSTRAGCPPGKDPDPHKHPPAPRRAPPARDRTHPRAHGPTRTAAPAPRGRPPGHPGPGAAAGVRSPRGVPADGHRQARAGPRAHATAPAPDEGNGRQDRPVVARPPPRPAGAGDPSLTGTHHETRGATRNLQVGVGLARVHRAVHRLGVPNGVANDA